MTQPLSPATSRYTIYPNRKYGETPHLVLPDANPAASNLARLMVKLGVDGQSPRPKKASFEEQRDRRPYLEAMRRAAAGTGFMVSARFETSDGSDSNRAHYLYQPGKVELLVMDRPPGAPLGRAFRLNWILGDGGVYELPAPVADTGEGSSDPVACADAFATLWSRAGEADSDSRLNVVFAKLVLPESSSLAEIADRVAYEA